MSFPDWFLNWQNCPPGPQADRAKFLADKADEIATEVATSAALTTIFNNILTAAQAGLYRLVVDVTTLPGVSIPVVINVLHAKLGYTANLLGTNLTIAWDYVGVTGLPDNPRFPPFP